MRPPRLRPTGPAAPEQGEQGRAVTRVGSLGQHQPGAGQQRQQLLDQGHAAVRRADREQRVGRLQPGTLGQGAEQVDQAPVRQRHRTALRRRDQEAGGQVAAARDVDVEPVGQLAGDGGRGRVQRDHPLGPGEGDGGGQLGS